MLEPLTSWTEVSEAARSYQESGRIFRSTKRHHEYRILSVTADRIGIERLGWENDTLSREGVEKAVTLLNSMGGRIRRGTLIRRVARETTFVCLHPRVRWSEDHVWVEEIATPSVTTKPVYEDFGQAPDDDPAQLQTFSRRVRAGQPKFRANLLNAYGAQCAISGWGPAEVLEAAHILWHSSTGLNHIDNGILLRSDLHTLFDEGLLRIDPERLVVVLDRSLEATPYWSFHGVALRARKDGTHPGVECLSQRWRSTVGR